MVRRLHVVIASIGLPKQMQLNIVSTGLPETLDTIITSIWPVSYLVVFSTSTAIFLFATVADKVLCARAIKLYQFWSFWTKKSQKIRYKMN